MAVVIGSNLRKEIAGSLLFEGVSFSVERGDRLSLSGPNGAGKTTLLRMLVGETEVHGGELVFAKGTRIALHDQRPPLEHGLTLREYALSGARDLVETEEELRSLEQAMASGDHGQATLRRYAEAQARLEHAGGYDWRDRAARVLRGLGFREGDLDRPLDTFSGGELTRASLARALSGDPDLLLLDEPTNHLDVENLEWLEQELQSLDAAVILVAHDRWFLEAVTTAVLEIEAGRSLFFPGPWHVWRLEKAHRAAAAAKTAERVGTDIARLERFVERFRYKKSKAKQAQAKLTQIARLQEERSSAAGEYELLTRRSRSLGFDFLKPARSGRTVVEAKNLEIVAGEKELLDDASFAIERGEHVGLVGPNGSGKTTLLETILDRRDPVTGSVRLGYGVEAAYFSQHEVELDERGSVLDCAARATGLPRQQAQSLLGRFLFSGHGSARLRRRGGLLLPARGRARRARQHPRLRRACDGAAAAAGSVAARALPLLGLGDAREAGHRVVRRRAAAARAGAGRRVRRGLPPARRAPAPPRPREPGGPGAGAGRVPGDRAPRLARPGAARRGGASPAGDRGADASVPRRRRGGGPAGPHRARARRGT